MRPAARPTVRMPLSSASLAAMRYIVSCPDKKLFSFTLTGSAEKELCDAAESYLLTQLERSFTRWISINHFDRVTE